MTMVILHTNHGDITLELDAENAPATVANFLQYVRDGHYDNTIFHRVIDGFMIQGGGMEPGMKQKPMRAPVANEAGNGAQEQALHGRDGAHVRPAFGDRAILHQRRRQRFPRPQGAEPAGLGLLRLRQGRRRTGHRRQDQGRADGQQRHPTRTSRRRTSSSTARRGSRIKPTLFISDLHLSPARPALVAAFESFCARPAARRPPLSTCSAICSTSGSATISCASRWRARDRGLRCAASPTAGVPSVSSRAATATS